MAGWTLWQEPNARQVGGRASVCLGEGGGGDEEQSGASLQRRESERADQKRRRAASRPAPPSSAGTRPRPRHRRSSAGSPPGWSRRGAPAFFCCCEGNFSGFFGESKRIPRGKPAALPLLPADLEDLPDLSPGGSQHGGVALGQMGGASTRREQGAEFRRRHSPTRGARRCGVATVAAAAPTPPRPGLPACCSHVEGVALRADDLAIHRQRARRGAAHRARAVGPHTAPRVRGGAKSGGACERTALLSPLPYFFISLQRERLRPSRLLLRGLLLRGLLLRPRRRRRPSASGGACAHCDFPFAGCMISGKLVTRMVCTGQLGEHFNESICINCSCTCKLTALVLLRSPGLCFLASMSMYWPSCLRAYLYAQSS